MNNKPIQHTEHTLGQLKSILERGAASYAISTGITKFAAIANTLLVLTTLTTYAYGVAELALSVVGVFSIFQLAGLERTVVSDMGVEKGRGDVPAARRVFEDYLILLSALSIAAWAILFFGSEFVGRFFTDEIGSYFAIISFLFLAGPAAIATRVLFGVYFDFTGTAMMTFLQEATKLLFLGAFAFFGVITISVVLWAYVIAAVAPALLLLPRTIEHLKLLFAVPASGTSAPLHFFRYHNFWTLSSNYLDNSIKSFRVWLIKLFFGTEVVALYAVATGFVGHISSFLNLASIVSPVLPQYVDNRPIFYRIIDKTIKYQLILATAVIVGGLVFVPLIVTLLFPHYEASLPLFSLLVFALLPSGVINVFQTMFYTLKAQRSLFASQIFKLIFVLIVATISFATVGVYGIAIEYLSTVVFFGLERYRVLKRLYPDFSIDLRDFFHYDEYDKLLVQRLKLRVMGYIPLRSSRK